MVTVNQKKAVIDAAIELADLAYGVIRLSGKRPMDGDWPMAAETIPNVSDVKEWDTDGLTGFGVVLGSVRELLGAGSLGAGLDMLGLPENLHLRVADSGVLVALLPPGAFILAGLLLGLGKTILGKHEQGQTRADIREAEG